MAKRRAYLLLFATAAVLLACCLMGSAAPIPGKLLVAGWNESANFAYFMEGTSENTFPAAGIFSLGDIAPDSYRVTYSTTQGEGGLWVPVTGNVWTADIDGSNAINLTSSAGLGGISCMSRWSPDGTQIAFHHCDPVEGLFPCQAGFHVWVMNSDGTGARPVTPAGTAPTSYPTWAPNGHSLLCNMDGVGAVTVNIDGTSIRPVPGVNGQDGKWSPDGSKLVSSWIKEEVVGGEPGIWRQLRLANPDGTDPRVIVEQFVKDSDVRAHIAKYNFQPPDFDWFNSIRALVGPLMPVWAPTGDKIAFLAALPFDPDGPGYHYQEEVWLYDLNTAALTRLTNDLNAEISLSWNGNNTYPDYPQVTVDNVTIIFSEVDGPGLTTILWDDDPPDVPTGHRFDYEFYDLSTTAQVTGPATVCMSYDQADVPEGPAEEQLALLHYNEALQAWQDITTSRDPVANTVCGQTESLSPIALHGVRKTQFPDVPAWGYGPDGLDSYWAYYHVMACVQAGIVAGYEDGTYQPSMAVTRDQMAVYVARALAGGDGDVPEGPATATFVDVPKTHWAYRHVEYAVSQNVVQGYDATHYGPANVVDRGQMAVFIARAMVAPGGDAAVPDPVSPRGFPDVATGFWAYKQVEYCAGQGVVNGYEDGKYHPEIVVTRDQMAVYVARAFGL